MDVTEFTATRKEEPVKHHPALPNYIRAIIIAPSGSGKPYLLLNLIMRLLKWDQLYLVDPSVDDPRYYDVIKDLGVHLPREWFVDSPLDIYKTVGSYKSNIRMLIVETYPGNMVHEVIIAALVVVVLPFLTVYGLAQTLCLSKLVTAECQLRTNPSTENPTSQITGTVTFRQSVTSNCRRLGVLFMQVQIQGLIRNVNSQYGLHVHQSADLSKGCESMGPHFNPLLSPHGAPSDSFDMRHLGDFGSVLLGSDGQVNVTKIDYLANLVGKHTIVGRGLVLHAMMDDLGLGGRPDSKTTGNAGSRLACCVIRWPQTRETTTQHDL